MVTYAVQECGCIALPEELQKKTGLYPGASFQFEVAEDGSSITLTSIQRAQPSNLNHGVVCGAQAPA
jgi:hypothetical protein